MVLLAHLSPADIGRCVSGAGDVDMERHVRVCVYCAQRLGKAAEEANIWERRGVLRRLVRVDASREIVALLAEIEEEHHRHAA